MLPSYDGPKTTEMASLEQQFTEYANCCIRGFRLLLTQIAEGYVEVASHVRIY